jgi:uncharacterized membrane protein YjjP (DUF1212 family)
VAASSLSLMQALTLFAGVLAVASLMITALFVHDRRHRLPGLLLSTGLICLLVAPLFSTGTIQIVVVSAAILLVAISGVLSLRSLRARSD